MKEIRQYLTAIILFTGIFLLPKVAMSQPLVASGKSDYRIKVIELRNYALKPGHRNRFVKFMNQIIIPKQESQHGYILSQFGLREGDDNYVWLRGFADMPTRSQFLKDFYSSGYWKQHRDETNSMMTNIDYIYLLKPITIKEKVVDTDASISTDELKKAEGIAVINFYKAKNKRDKLIDFFAKQYLSFLQNAGITDIHLWISEMGENDFWLPVVQDPDLFVTITYYQNEEDYKLKMKKVNEQLSSSVKKELKAILTSSETQIVYPLSIQK